MRRAIGLYQSSVGKKILMAVSGLLLVGFVLGHMAGNLKVFFGQEAFDHYAHGLRAFGEPFLAHGQFLWIARIGLLAAVGIHMLSAFLTWRQSVAARGGRYKKSHSLSFSYASRTMRWGGVLIAGFVIYHLLHLTSGTVHVGFTDSPYENVHLAFSNPVLAGFYVVIMVLLGFHLYHGIWSATQTLDWDNPRIKHLWRPIAATATIVVVLGFVSVPIGVLAGIVEEPAPRGVATAASTPEPPAPGAPAVVPDTGTAQAEPAGAGSTH
jgi:succinate dehydrogenase / fumarate reductase cytochrome b subunit